MLLFQVTCITRDNTAFDGKDYTGHNKKIKIFYSHYYILGGKLTVLFRSGETTKLLKIPIINDLSCVGKEEVFEVVRYTF